VDALTGSEALSVNAVMSYATRNSATSIRA
jgi:hypothetical protein